uniref:Uncharacterized protein n=1 Tax=Parastrongyloides trichosuri TaxID=131310 RepID=A0A0N4ZFF8_PARTI
MKMKLSSRKSYTCNRAAYIENYIRGQLGFHSSGKGEKSSTLQNSTPSFSESFNLLKNQNQSSNTSSSEELSTSSSLLPTTSSNIAQDCKMNGNKTIVEQQTPTFQGCKPSTSKELPSSSFIEDITSNKNNISYLLQKCVKNRRLPKNEQREFYCLPLIDRTPQIINQTMGPCPEISKYKTAALLFTENVMSKEKEIVIKNDRALISKLEEVYKPKDKGIPEKYKEEVERIFALTEQKKVFDHLNSFN